MRHAGAAGGDPAVARGHAEAGLGHGKSFARGRSFLHQQASGRVPPRRQAAGADRRTVRDGLRDSGKSCHQHADSDSGSSPEENDAGVWFARGIALEEDPATQTEALAAYQKVLEFESSHAAAHINLGTLYYNRQDFSLAEKHYRAALEADPRYALAYFDLGNVLDETGRVQEAIQTYKMAIQLAPTYADAHYNLALAYEKTREPRKALKHWQAYIKLDTTGPWSVHARNQIQRILQADTLKLVHSRRG